MKSIFTSFICPKCYNIVAESKTALKCFCPNCKKIFTPSPEISITLPAGYYEDGERSIKDNKPYRPDKGHFRLELPQSFIVIDIETSGLDSFWHSITEIVAIKVVDNTPTEKFETLVNPHFELEQYIIDLTGITNEMVEDAPDIADVLPKLRIFLGDAIVLGHNCSRFDINFLYDYFDYVMGIPLTNDYVDTMYLAKHALPGLESYSLKNLVTQLHLSDLPTHRAEKDCWATLACYNALKKIIIDNNISLTPKHSPKIKLWKASDIKPTSEVNEEHPLFGKEIVFTGTLSMLRKDAMQQACNCGAICKDGLSQKTDFLVIGDTTFNPSLRGQKSSKQKKAESMISQGKKIEIISESTFIDLIHWDPFSE